MAQATISTEFLKAIPKTDLHLHIDGSLRLPTLIDLAREENVKLPSYTEEGLRKLVFKNNYKNLEEYLLGFRYTCAVMETEEALERIAYELAIDSFADGVRYIEPRIAAQRNANKDLSIEAVLESINRGFAKAAREINAAPAIRKGDEPRFAYGIIGTAMRMFEENYSGYYKNFIMAHRYSTNEERYALASLELVKALVKIRDSRGIPIVGFDLAGAEDGFPAEVHREAYWYAHKNFLQKTVHAGEAYGAASIFQAITDLHADRIGHGTHLFDERMVDRPTKKEREEYVSALAQYITDRRITIEICLTSNAQTHPELKNIAEHPCRKMLEDKLSVTFCTDNTLISNTTSTNEFRLAVENFGITKSQLKGIIAYGFKRSFYPGEYIEKRRYVRQVLNCFDALDKKFYGTG